MLTTVDRGSKTQEGNWSASSFSIFLRRTLPSTCSSSVHLAYIYRVHKCNNNLLNAPCGHCAGKQMLDFTSKIEHSRGYLNKNSLLAHLQAMKRGTTAHMWRTRVLFGCCGITKTISKTVKYKKKEIPQRHLETNNLHFWGPTTASVFSACCCLLALKL